MYCSGTTTTRWPAAFVLPTLWLILLWCGEVSAAMLGDFACRYVLVGHSERRSLYGENDALVAAKFIAAQSAGLCPILCVGETL